MVALVRGGKSQRAVARHFGVTLRMVQRWLHRAGQRALANVDWKAGSHAPKAVANKTQVPLENEVCALRKQLATGSALGFVGAQAIRDALQDQSQYPRVPSVRTDAFSGATVYLMANSAFVVQRPHRAGTCLWPPNNWRRSSPST